jgi:hypothetical protein
MTFEWQASGDHFRLTKGGVNWKRERASISVTADRDSGGLPRERDQPAMKSLLVPREHVVNPGGVVAAG